MTSSTTCEDSELCMHTYPLDHHILQAPIIIHCHTCTCTLYMYIQYRCVTLHMAGLATVSRNVLIP